MRTIYAKSYQNRPINKNKMHEHSNICPKLLLTPVVSFESCFFSFFSGGNCPSRVGIVRLGWELSVLGGNCPSWVGIVSLGWELSVLRGNCPSWVGIFRLVCVSHFILMSGPFMPNLIKIGP